MGQYSILKNDPFVINVDKGIYTRVILKIMRVVEYLVNHDT